jgi:hypothetical protein
VIDTWTARYNPDGARRQYVSGGQPLTLALQLPGNQDGFSGRTTRPLRRPTRRFD